MSFHSAKNSELGQLLLTDRARSELRPRLPCCLGIDSKLLVDWYQQSVLQCVTGDGWPCLCVVSGEKSRRSTGEIWVLGPAVSNFHTSHSVHTYKHTVHTSYIHSTHIQTYCTHIINLNLNIKTSCRALYYETALEQKNKSERERDALNIGDLWEFFIIVGQVWFIVFIFFIFCSQSFLYSSLLLTNWRRPNLSHFALSWCPEFPQRWCPW